jgi:CRP/FNR family transcriptional regulator, cyclic AMP receptor protein
VRVEHDRLVPLLSRTDLFGALAADELAACAAAFRPLRFDKGATLFTRGDPATSLYIVAEGRVRLAVCSDEGRELSFRHAAAGDLFGEIGALDGSVRTADATALTAVTLFALDRNAFRALCQVHAGISAGVISFLCRRLRETSSQLEAIALHPLEVRLARFLVFALGNCSAPPGKRVPLDLGFSQGELAQLLGATRPKVNIALGVLESAGAINRTLDRLFCDPTKLAEIARQDDV